MMLQMDMLENTLKCEKLAGYLLDGDCVIDDYILENTETSCDKTLGGKHYHKSMFPIESMHRLGATKSSGFNNSADYKLCKFPLKNIENIKKEHYDKLQESALLRVFNRNKYEKAEIDKKKEITKDSLFVNLLIDRSKQIVGSGQQHAPMMFVKSGDEISIVLLVFKGDEDKERILKNVRNAITRGKIKKYWLVIEAWTSENPFILPRHDEKRKETILISEYEKDEITGKQIHLPFERDASGKPIWQKQREILADEDTGDRWNFFLEDTIVERMAKVREEVLKKDIKKVKEQLIEEEKKKGTSKEELESMSKTFDKVAEDMVKKMKRQYGDDKI